MESFPFAVVGFDLDGTLLDTAGDLAAAVNHVRATLGCAPMPVEAVRLLIGGGARTLLARALEGEGPVDGPAFDALFDSMIAFHEAHLANTTRPYPGAVAALDQLDALGVRYGVVTNKLHDRAERLLTLLGLGARMAFVIGGGALGPDIAKPSPAPLLEMVRRGGGGRAAFVGDSHFDIDAARAAQMPSVAVRFGYSDRAVETLRADAVIDHFDALIPTLRRL